MNQHHSKPHHQHQHHQQQQHPSGDVQQQRREFLWRERVKLEMHVQVCIAQTGSLQREWQLLATRKAAWQQRRSGLSTQILLSGLAGMRQLPAERLFQYERERMQQEELRLQQALLQCQRDLMALEAQIEVIQIELSFLC
jgi:hypothetical protein